LFSRSLNQIICLWRNILKIIIIEISLKLIKFRGYLSVFSCIFSTVWPKFLPLDSGTQLLPLPAWTWSLFSCPFVLRVNGCVYFYSLQYFCSQTSEKAQICLTNCICRVINLACSFCKMDLKLQIISFTDLVFESIDGGWKNQASYEEISIIIILKMFLHKQN
jgi:hypothetical protein